MKKPVIITGGAGFAGQYLAALLAEEDRPVHLFDKTGSLPAQLEHRSRLISIHRMDLTAPRGLAGLLEQIDPAEIYHLAGIANVRQSWEGEALTFKVNVIGAVNLLAAVKNAGIAPAVLMVGSGEIYGLIDPALQPITENQPPDPRSPYSASKLCQEIVTRQMANHLKSKIVMVRPFNHIGPGQHPGFVTSDFARQIARIERGEQPPEMYVGNLSTHRDFTDVRDTVRAYVQALRQGEHRAVYNVCSGKTLEIRYILDWYLDHSRVNISVRIDKDKFRPADVPYLCGSPALLKKTTGWEPRFDINATLASILDHWRARPGE